MKTLFLAIQYPPHIGGVPSFYYHFSRSFKSNELVVITAKEDGWQKIDSDLKLRIFRYKFLNQYNYTKNILKFILLNIRLFSSTIYVIFKEKIKILILGSDNPILVLQCYILKVILKIDFLVFIHGDGDSPRVKCKRDVIKNFLYKRAKSFIVNSNFTKERIISKFNIPSDKIFVLYPGVDTKKFHPHECIDLKNRLNLNQKKILLTIGRLDERKGHDMVLRALPEIIKKIPNIMYLIVGHGKGEPRLNNIIKELKLSEYVKFTGKISDSELVDYYNICDIFIMPNRELEGGDTEGFGMVFLEANACGKVVIGGRCGGAIEAIEDGISGLLVNPYSTEDIASKTISLLKDELITKQMGEAGLKRAVNDFDWEGKVRNNINELKKLFLS